MGMDKEQKIRVVCTAIVKNRACLRGLFPASSFADNSPAFKTLGSMTKKSKVPFGTTEPCLFAGVKYLFSAKGAAFMSSLGQRPRIRATPNR
jgi:hypothetical protein